MEGRGLLFLLGPYRPRQSFILWGLLMLPALCMTSGSQNACCRESWVHIKLQSRHICTQHHLFSCASKAGNTIFSPTEPQEEGCVSATPVGPAGAARVSAHLGWVAGVVIRIFPFYLGDLSHHGRKLPRPPLLRIMNTSQAWWCKP